MSKRCFDDPHGTSDAARQGLLDNRIEHGPKRHRTLKRRKVRAKKKRQAVKHAAAVQKAKRRRFLVQARRYWQGEEVDHPE